MLIEAKAKDEAILASIGEGLVATDKNGKIILVNGIFEKILDWRSDEVVGKPIIEIIHLNDESGKEIIGFNQLLSRILKYKTTVSIMTWFKRKDGTHVPVSVNGAPVMVDTDVIGAVVVFRDITEERKIDKAKNEFVSLASHQLRTPLTTISWYTEMILNGDVGVISPDQKKYLEEVYKGNRRMIQLVNTLLDVSRIDLGTFKADIKSIDLPVLVESIINEHSLKIESKKLNIIRKFSANIPIFKTDPKFFSMVVQNLITNSVEYTQPGGAVGVSLSLVDDKTIQLKISDNGYGIPKDQQDQIFTKFFRADNVRAKDTMGTGLGLYIVKSTVENAGGKIWFESVENKGTTFYVELPINVEKHVEKTNEIIKKL